mmetsp:Transcript_83580/g.167403  ORF Transcript_83580/g.167403 Transcript_83580/m.167403 type:complete len:267 (-) Transcript_83580:292-1092(-)
MHGGEGAPEGTNVPASINMLTATGCTTAPPGCRPRPMALSGGGMPISMARRASPRLVRRVNWPAIFPWYIVLSHRLITAFVERPSKSFAIFSQLFPHLPCASTKIASSSPVQPPFFSDGSSWLNQRSRHCLPTRPWMWSAIASHFVTPTSMQSMIIWSSSLVHGSFTRPSRALRFFSSFSSSSAASLLVSEVCSRLYNWCVGCALEKRTMSAVASCAYLVLCRRKEAATSRESWSCGNCCACDSPSYLIPVWLAGSANSLYIVFGL